MPYPITNARWRLHGANDLLPYTLLLEADGVCESSGVTTSQLAAARGVLTPSVLGSLREDGVPLDSTELAVHARLHRSLGFGAFGAAHVNLMPLQSTDTPADPCIPVCAMSIADGEAHVGMLQDDAFGPPYIALAEVGELTDCLLLTWSGDWTAYRTYMRTDTLRAGSAYFTAALVKHKDRVAALLGPPGVLSSLRGTGCVN